LLVISRIRVTTTKGNKMNKQELETRLQTALEQRKQGYALNVPTAFISAVNDQIRNFRKALAEVN
jgi:hypothetical protein